MKFNSQSQGFPIVSPLGHWLRQTTHSWPRDFPQLLGVLHHPKSSLTPGLYRELYMGNKPVRHGFLLCWGREGERERKRRRGKLSSQNSMISQKKTQTKQTKPFPSPSGNAQTDRQTRRGIFMTIPVNLVSSIHSHAHIHERMPATSWSTAAN